MSLQRRRDWHHLQPLCERLPAEPLPHCPLHKYVENPFKKNINLTSAWAPPRLSPRLLNHVFCVQLWHYNVLLKTCSSVAPIYADTCIARWQKSTSHSFFFPFHSLRIRFRYLTNTFETQINRPLKRFQPDIMRLQHVDSNTPYKSGVKWRATGCCICAVSTGRRVWPLRDKESYGWASRKAAGIRVYDSTDRLIMPWLAFIFPSLEIKCILTAAFASEIAFGNLTKLLLKRSLYRYSWLRFRRINKTHKPTGIGFPWTFLGT